MLPLSPGRSRDPSGADTAVGYKPATQSTTVAADETAALSFSLAAAVVQLDELVTTATGEQRKLEIGNAVTTIDAAKIGLRVAGSGAILDRTPQRRLLRETDMLTFNSGVTPGLSRSRSRRGTAVRGTLRMTALALLLVLLPACGLLNTDQPNIIDPNEINSPDGAPALALGALTDFAFAKDGDGTQFEDALILASGLLADEFIHSTTPPSQQEVDQRTTAFINPTLSDVYRNMHKGRAGLENAAAALRQFLVLADETPGHRGDAEPGRLHLRLLRGDLLLRCSV